MSTFAVHEDAVFTAKFERAPGQDRDQIPKLWLAGLHFETNGSAPLPGLFHACLGPLFAVCLGAIGGPVLRLVRLEGWMEDIWSVLDLEVEGVV